MNKLIAYIILCLPLIAYAEPTVSEQSKAVICAACHGQNGISANPDWPNIAGQHQQYLLKQLQAIKENKTRQVPSMTALLAGMSEQEMQDLALFYAKMPPAEGETPLSFVARGERLYRGGDFSKHITACIACHGPKGTGNAQAGFPLIAGQHAPYTITQLKAFKEGMRSNDLNHIMQDISARMSEDDMAAVAHYIEGLH